MEAPNTAPRAEPGRLRELLAMDRQAAGEARVAEHGAQLTTTDYHMPWRVRAKRRWRSDRRLRIAVSSSCALLLALVALLRLPLWNASAAKAAGQSPVSLRAEQPGTYALRAEPRPPKRQEKAPRAPEAAPSPVIPSVAPRAPEPESAPYAAELSPQLRLQRADVWLNHKGQHAALEARRLLESALTDVATSAHGQAALAEACLRLEDAACARSAIAAARRIRPMRGGYRALERRIEASFAAAR